MAGVGLECLSMAGFVLLQQRLLKAAGARPAVTWLLATDYASNAIACVVPIVGRAWQRPSRCGSSAGMASTRPRGA